MKQLAQHTLALGMCLALLVGGIAGCADLGQTVREHPRATAGTAIGAAGGALAGGLISRDATGAVVGGLVGALAGGLIGNAIDAKQQDVAHTDGRYDYASAQGTRVDIRHADVEPSIVRPGGQVNLVTRYALLTPNPAQEVTVVERWNITRGSQLVGNPVRTVRREGGSWVSTLPVTLPTTAQPGEYRVAVTIEAAGDQDSEASAFTVTW